MPDTRIKSYTTPRTGVIIGIGALVAAATALWVRRQATLAERSNLPTGRFIDVDGVRVHYVERGTGTPVVLIHGNAVCLQDFEAAGLIDRLAQNHRVIAFDRPGFGHSDRPRDRLWTPSAQADLLRTVLNLLNVDRPAVLGHSMGTMVALAMALNYPAQVRQLILLGGYYYPTVRIDALLTAPVASPGIGDVLRYTVAALTARAMLKGAVKAMFTPRDIPAGFFSVLSREMMVRPSQLKANAEDAAFMIPAASSLAGRYAELRMPVSILAGAADVVVNPEAHAVRLHEELLNSDLVVLPGVGHMVHYTAQSLIQASLDDATGSEEDCETQASALT